MKQKLILLISFSLAMSVLSAQELRFSVHPFAYFTEDGQRYLDVYSTLDASSIAYEPTEIGTWYAAAYVNIQVGEKVDPIAFTLTHQDSASGAPLLLQKSTFILDEMTPLEFKVFIKDSISNKSWNLADTFSFDFSYPFLSEPILLDSTSTDLVLYRKSGGSVIPKVNLGTPFFTNNTIEWYTEVANDTGKVVLNYRVENSLGAAVNGTQGFKRLQGSVSPVRVKYNFSDQPSGEYGIVVEVLNLRGKVIKSIRTSFLWYNTNLGSEMVVGGAPITKLEFEKSWGNWKNIAEYLAMVAPIANIADRRILMNLKEQPDTNMAAQFLVNFWNEKAPGEALDTWKGYQEIVAKVDAEFGSKTLKGYKTQMGRVFLQYGAPSLIEERPFDGKNYPYQIWQYDELKSASTIKQQNQVFIFVDQELIGRQYTLIHSSAQGEVKDHKWQYHLSRHTNSGPDIDATSTKYGRDNFGERISNSLILGNQGTWFNMYNN